MMRDERAAILSWCLNTTEEDAAKALRWMDAIGKIPEELVALTESPLERLFLAAMEYVAIRSAEEHIEDLGLFVCEEGRAEWCVSNEHALTIQAEIETDAGTFRVDLLITDAEGDSDGYQVVVELDGHDYHERTKEQAKADRSRDRALTRAGYRVVRFTGSEVYADPFGCAQWLADFVDELRFSQDREQERELNRGYEDHCRNEDRQLEIAWETAEVVYSSAALKMRRAGRFDAANAFEEMAHRCRERISVWVSAEVFR